MENKTYSQLLKDAEKIGLTVNKNTADADILGTVTDGLQQGVKATPKADDVVAVRAFTNYISDTGMVISKDWNGSKEHEYKKAADAYNYLITSGLVDDQS
ncbi:hypothetical protein BGL34_03065 [Fructilactobacillus lindneri]|uniref:Uncharacterized protein n=2 Tax=Fructilactobacillus lindneri TaxID=53444 RepID=A0A0R2JV97_9LACO|nr:hypothetical protein [Fructilactobacillus lindneri]ANZ57885.1 hypothetical protein AYR60_03465 [Fructilactobacillus lindneri]ANZ59154.1 hypothetical protein AYR59_03465 [Fructilactobacillus lindneri]KRN78650.1 hypothetical protein IV52_GL000926 [Fructilactobacillus lindneri DSM 20690 = JCM 11027]POG98204.1 hypothetical protein BGL31_03795 [Fructilactobacillus lindneri]POH01679.1 hypothetical protein BGL32_03635 [Fructilactobacillus lindneri]